MKDKKMCTLSIITPTYNRANLISNCYQSLLAQSNYDFEWIIVDDGSKDKTKEIVESFSQDKFPITYVFKKNGGKHTALNTAHPYIKGKYVLILDSDDYLVPTAVEQVIGGWKQFEDNKDIGLVTFLRGTPDGTPLCKAADEDEYKSVSINAYKRICIKSSDCCEVIRAELFKKYPFPAFPGEKFVAEGALWNRVGLTHKCVYINKVIYICEYLEGGLTKSGRKMRLRNPRGGMFTSNLGMNSSSFLKTRIKSGLLFTCYGFFAGMSPTQMSKECDSKLLMWMCLPFGWILSIIWKRKYK